VTPSAVAAATTPLPQPLAISAPVTVDFANMALIVRRPEAAGGSEKLLWREAHAALVKAEELGWPSGTRFVWGSSAPGQLSVCPCGAWAEFDVAVRFRGRYVGRAGLCGIGRPARFECVCHG
jgi:hypothetical protein